MDQLQPKYERDEMSRIRRVCGECQAGIVRLKYLTYFTWLNNELITVSNFPAWVCDICGRREYDVRAVNRLNTLLNHEVGSKQRQKRKTTPRRTDPDRLAPPLDKS